MAISTIYLDYHATTPCDPRVVDAMLPYFYENFGNPHSRNHIYGWEAEEAASQARFKIASLIGADDSEIIFTSGATESNNLAIKGVMYFLAHTHSKRNHLIVSQIEHKCVLESARFLETQGFRVSFVPVTKEGIVDLGILESMVDETTALISVMHVNNEIGTIQPIREIADIAHRVGALLHSDAAQSLARLPIKVNELDVDLMSFSAHKVYGPKGIGALYVRKRPRRVRLVAQMSGGGQERAMRSGTLPVPLCVGFGKACSIIKQELHDENARISTLSEKFYEEVTKKLTHVYLNGARNQRVPGSWNLSFAGVEGESLMMAIKNLAVSSGSACTSTSLEPSYVLKALGISDELAHTSLRISFGRFTTKEDTEIASKSLILSVQKLRAISPLWEMIEEGIDLSTIQWVS